MTWSSQKSKAGLCGGVGAAVAVIITVGILEECMWYSLHLYVHTWDQIKFCSKSSWCLLCNDDGRESVMSLQVVCSFIRCLIINIRYDRSNQRLRRACPCFCLRLILFVYSVNADMHCVSQAAVVLKLQYLNQSLDEPINSVRTYDANLNKYTES